MKKLYTLILTALCTLSATAADITLTYKGTPVANGGTLMITETDPELANDGLIQFVGESYVSSSENITGATFTLTAEGEHSILFCVGKACIPMKDGVSIVENASISSEPQLVSLHQDDFFFEAGQNVIRGKLTIKSAQANYSCDIVMTDDPEVMAVHGVKADPMPGDVLIANMAGAVIYNGKAKNAPQLPAGVYIYKVGGQAKKIMK